jgi:pyrroloquinoline quinone biosynthesis protein B
MIRSFFIFLLLFSFKCNSQNDSTFILVLGIAQDGGYPHIGCTKDCCKDAWKNDSLRKNVTCLALVSPKEKKWWMLEASPDMNRQLHLFSALTNSMYPFLPAGIFLTHAHIGHYTGLMYLGKEALNSKEVPVYVLPRMKEYLEKNGPWSQLVSLKNIVLIKMTEDVFVELGKNIGIKAFTVPHRDEYSETAGFRIEAAGRKFLFIPDIDKWTKYQKDIVAEVNSVDHAFLDGTFYSGNELPGRDINEVPHPLVKESLFYFGGNFDISKKRKICFIHFNHTNPLIKDKLLRENLKLNGFDVAEEGMIFR